MSPVPDGAQLSEDGHYWWDGSQWQPVDEQAAGQGSGQGSGQGQAQGAAAFMFNDPAQVLVSDENDDPLPHANAQTKVSFGAVWNIGTAAGTATVTISVDGSQAQTWTSPQIEPQQGAQPDDGYVHNCGAYPAGRHTFVAHLDPLADNAPNDPSNEVELLDT